LYQHLQQTLSDTPVTTLPQATEPIRPPTTQPSRFTKVSPDDTELLESQSKRAVLVCAPGKDEDEEDEVCVMDLTKAEWWTIVDSERDRKTLRDESEVNVPCELTSGDDDDSYVMVDDRDLGDALSNFVALSMKRYPEAKTLSPKQLNKLMEQTFGGLKPPSTVGKIYGWAQLAYSSYGWGCCLWSLYKEPVMVKLAATGALRACSWLLILLW